MMAERDMRPRYVIVAMLDGKPTEVLTNGDGAWRTVTAASVMRYRLEDNLPKNSKIEYLIVRSARA